MTPLYHSTQLPTTSGIYRITCTANKKIYIGSSINLRHRYQEHLSGFRRNAHENPKLQHAWNKYGPDAFIFEIIEFVEPEMVIEREQYWIDTLNPLGKNGFNIAPIAGTCTRVQHTQEFSDKLRTRMLGNTHLLGHKHSEETRAKMIKSRTGKKHSQETKEKMSRAAIGRVRSPETCAKISAAHLGKPAHNRGKKLSREDREQLREVHTAEMKTLIVIAPDGTESTIQGIRQFCEKHHLDHSALRKVATGKQGNHKGWKARYPTTNE